MAQRFLRGPLLSDNQQGFRFPEHWETEIDQYYPQSVKGAPTAGIFLSLASKTAEDVWVHWTEEDYPLEMGDIAGAYTATPFAVGTKVGTTLAAGAPVYLQCSKDDCSGVLKGQMLKVYNKAAPGNGWVLIDVQNVSITDDTNSYVSGVVYQNADAGGILEAASLGFVITGNAQYEMSMLPETRSQLLLPYLNHTSIMMGAADYSGTEVSRLERFTPDSVADMMKKCHLMYMQEFNRALFHSVLGETRKGNKSKWTFDGLISLLVKANPTNIQSNGQGNIIDMTALTFSGPGAPSPGDSYRKYGYNMFKYLDLKLGQWDPNPKKLVITSATVMSELEYMMQEWGNLTFTPAQDTLGLQVKVLKGLRQKWTFVEDPQFTLDPTLERCAFVTNKEFHNLMPLNGRATKFVDGSNMEANAWTWVDGKKVGYFGEYTLKSKNFRSQALLRNIGLPHQ